MTDLLSPMFWVFLCLLGSVVLLRRGTSTRAYRAGMRLLLIAFVSLYLMSSGTLKNGIIYLFESRYPFPSESQLSTVDAIVVLGGGLLERNELRTKAEPSGFTYSRVACGVRAFKASGAKYLVLAGGPPGEGNTGTTEAHLMREVAIVHGVDANQILTESQSSNTREHAAQVSKLLEPRGIGRIGLVTSALHLPRAVRSFRKFYKEGVLAIPCDHLFESWRWSPRSVLPTAGALYHNTMAVHEIVGSMWYQLQDLIASKDESGEPERARY